MNPPRTLTRRIARAVVRCAVRLMPADDAHSTWADAMRHEVDHIRSDRAALGWAMGCVRAGFWQQVRALHIGTPVSGSFRDVVKDAARYWEPRRISYNLVLAAVVVGWIALTWPHFRPALTMQGLFFIIVLAVIANACYCAAYVVDVCVQHSALQPAWRGYRWSLWLFGTLIGSSFIYYWIADEIYAFLLPR